MIQQLVLCFLKELACLGPRNVRAVRLSGQGHGLLDDLQLLAELSIVWLFWIAKLPLTLLECKGIFCKQKQRSIPHLHRNGLRERRKEAACAEGVLKKPCLLNPGGESVTTAGDIIQISGYPLETHKTVTIDGYILYMYRIPRPDSPKATFFLHGMGDSSICWVSGGVTASPAFEAYNLGFDVWLGNSRNTPPRQHINPVVQKGYRYWKFTSNELGELDVLALVDLIDAIKSRELSQRKISEGCSSKKLQQTFVPIEPCSWVGPLNGGKIKICTAGGCLKTDPTYSPRQDGAAKHPEFKYSIAEQGSSIMNIICRGCDASRIKQDAHQELADIVQSVDCAEHVPEKVYSLSAVGHSLGCSSLLIYTISSLRKSLRHKLNGLVLLAPAGFHQHRAPMALFSNNFLKPVAWILTRVLRLPGFGVQMPAGLTRFTAFKCLHDFRQIRALGELAQRFVYYWTRDGSPWHKAACASHYVCRHTPGQCL